jgi:hypothetical protein
MAMIMPDQTATAKEEPPCPYKHIADLPPSAPTNPNMVVINVEAAFSRVLFARMDPAP